MNLFSDLDDRELAGDERLAAVVDEIRAYGSGPAPEVRPALMAVLTHGLAGHPAPIPPVDAPGPVKARRRRVGLLQTARARLVIGTAAASVGIFATGAAGALPAPAQSAFQRAVSAMGIELPATVSVNDRVPDASGATSDAPAGADARSGEAGDGSTHRGQDDRPARSDGNRGGQSGADEVPAATSGSGKDQGGPITRMGPDDRPGARPVPAAGKPDPGPGAAEEFPRPAIQGPPVVGPGNRPDGLPGWADIDDDNEKGSGWPEVPAGELPDNAGDRPSAPAAPEPAAARAPVPNAGRSGQLAALPHRSTVRAR